MTDIAEQGLGLWDEADSFYYDVLKSDHRAVFGDSPKLQTDPHFRDYIPFHEYFHGDTGRGGGASHQTGWTGLVAKLLQPRKEST